MPDCVLVCSEPLFPDDWKLLHNHELIAISSGLEVQSILLSSQGPASGVP
jgi:hypothetical protein